MTTGSDLVTTGKQWFYEPYYNLDDTRFGPYHMDCSGFMVRICRACGAPPPYWALNSEGLDIWGRNNGLEIPLADAYTIAGAFVSKWGTGNHGHIAMSQGDGQHTLETPAYGIYGHASGQANILQRDWTNACLAPGIDFTNKGFGENLKALAASIDSAMRLDLHYGDVHPVAVTWLQVMLNRALPSRQRPLIVDGNYGANTLQALNSWEYAAEHFFHVGGDFFPGGGEVNAKVWFWLRKAAHI